MKRLCNARLRCKPDRRCRKLAITGKLRCRLHGGTPRHGRHLSEDAHHSVSFGKARAARGPLYRFDPVVSGRARARWAIRGPDGRFLPGKTSAQNKYIDAAQRLVEKALVMARTKRPASTTEASKPAPGGEPRAVSTERTQDDPNPVPATSVGRLGLAEDFTAAGAVALAKAKDFLATPIDFRQLADPAWLNDGENRKNAAILLRFAQEQMNVAMQLIRDQLDAARVLPARGAFDYEQKVLGQLIEDFDREEAQQQARAARQVGKSST